MSTVGTLDAINNLDPETFNEAVKQHGQMMLWIVTTVEEHNNLTNNGEKPTLVASAGSQRLPYYSRTNCCCTQHLQLPCATWCIISLSHIWQQETTTDLCFLASSLTPTNWWNAWPTIRSTFSTEDGSTNRSKWKPTALLFSPRANRTNNSGSRYDSKMVSTICIKASAGQEGVYGHSTHPSR